MRLQGSKTKELLMRAFAGECQARTRYLMAAGRAESEGWLPVCRAFHQTAKEEEAHACAFYRLLGPLAGSQIEIIAAYPVHSGDLGASLRDAQEDEYREWELYAALSQIARDEGFLQAAALFLAVSSVEKTHGDRFGQLAAQAEGGTLLRAREARGWRCQRCGFPVYGCAPPQTCPLCGGGQRGFARSGGGEG
ncbi:rubrerythrin family protein [Bittarella massiliensis (ex Durand et al. 2017)]|uniref:rubrerythrin family protein n=1 Tax=Bittarella massiliensis (ex Durand et al. 2017) TaxID=1720313 RepID=UPI001AA18622|nr:rubrerythrin family protein [Bittarella massiliensis (ex Durand et al. 2017)]MBO1678596.1 rubrerythrin family protein [Bittarella massiliensis (ex Durand et al. 2017)]